MVWLIQRVLVVRRVTGVYLGGAMVREQCCERLVDKYGIGHTGSDASSIPQKRRVHRRTQACSAHATIMPRRCLCKAPLQVSSAGATHPTLLRRTGR